MKTGRLAQDLRAFGMACGLLAIFGAASASAGNAAAIRDAFGVASDPIGPASVSVTFGGLHDKWAGVIRAVERDLATLASCEMGDCTVAGQHFLAIVQKAQARDGRARLGEINRAINLAIRATRDSAQYGVEDFWASPLQTLANGAGDCEDYAIAKMIALRYAGFMADDLRLLIVRDLMRGEDHAILAVRFEGQWLALDNRRMTMVDARLLPRTAPMFSIAFDAIRQYEDATPVARGEAITSPAAISEQTDVSH